MVYTLPPRNSPNASAGNQIGRGLAESFQQSFVPAAQKQYERGQLQQALGKLRAQSENQNASPTDILYNLIEASSYSPEIGRNLPQLYEKLNQAREAQALKGFKFNQGEGGQAAMQQGGISSQQQINPQIEQSLRQQKTFPNNEMPNQAPGNLPQQATQGQVRPVLAGDELLQKAQQRQQQFASLGIIKPFSEFYEQVANENEQNRVYNSTVEGERQKRIDAQETYGDLAEERLKKLYPEASDEESAIFRRKGEDVAAQGKSEADIKRYLAKEASIFKNIVSNAEKNLSAPRIQNALKRGLLGNKTTNEQAESDARSAIKPLIKEGLYEKARTLLSQSGFYPEERERIVFGEIPEGIKKQVDSIPNASFEGGSKLSIGNAGAFPVSGEKEYSLKSKIDLYSNLAKLFKGKENPDINLVLLRKEYEDKGYDWRLLKDSLNQMVQSGNIKLSTDQENQLNSYLNSPPLNNLEKILHGLNLRGR